MRLPGELVVAVAPYTSVLLSPHQRLLLADHALSLKPEREPKTSKYHPQGGLSPPLSWRAPLELGIRRIKFLWWGGDDSVLSPALCALAAVVGRFQVTETGSSLRPPL